MSWLDPAGLYRPGDTLVHRAPLWLRLGGLAAVGVAVVVLRGPWPSLALLGLVTVLALLARLPWRSTVRGLAPALLTALAAGGYQVWRRGWEVGVEVGADILTVVLAATVVTTTTRADVLLDAAVRALGPLRRLGARPESVALSAQLMLRTVPTFVELADETRDAARARGLERSARARLVPFAIRAVARAHQVGDALAARGIGDEPPRGERSLPLP